ncbi:MULTISPECIES: ATP-binding cassette domain-containing protein [Mammaliicoccus]|uniref:ATP-binding cassette domain-containing protein n=1 Tax=Mammaliicoccus sciuri TaxID=1296 RepID=A0ABT7HYE3_MAMSC|nr:MULTISPECIES: ATP-binding cassette domain-containing protein [Mammaliicoccus]MDL0112709.1 ATP-binding cassette domain-containing protein [Mammaliicoccus sciuri]MDL0117171.1 ATP-binding cassette domain-containing protein [Mammaliicoccus sciuri]WQJ65935.1 ATP-binding cassette domain-containing protein [Mammaliicoccus sciuri]
MLEIENLTKMINQRHIINGLSLTIEDQNLLISGKSGSGKSTLAKMIAGLDSNYTGSIKFNHRPQESIPLKQWMKTIQYVPQYQRDTLNPRKTVEYILREPLRNYRVDKEDYGHKIETVLERCLLPKSILKQRMSTLSGGQFQRVWIAKALIVEPEVLILDEATTNLDVMSEETIIQMLKTLEQVQLIIISHDPYVLNSFEGMELKLDGE